MKTLLFILSLMIATNAIAQCDSIVVVSMDKFSGAKYTYANRIIDTDTEGRQIGFDFMKNESGFSLGITVYDKEVVCMEKNSPIYLLFEDNSSLLLHNIHDFTCINARALINLNTKGLGKGVGSKNFEQIRTKKIKAIRVVLFKRFFEMSLSHSAASKILQSANCLFNFNG